MSRTGHTDASSSAGLALRERSPLVLALRQALVEAMAADARDAADRATRRAKMALVQGGRRDAA